VKYVKKYYANIDSAIIKGFHVREDHPHNSDDQSNQTIEVPDENIEKPPEEEVNLDDWMFFNQSDDYVSKFFEEEVTENTVKPPEEEEVNLDDWMFFNQSDDYVSKFFEETEN